MSKELAKKILSSPQGYTDESREVAEDYLKLLESQWTSVKFRLPEAGKMVMIFTPECLTTQAYFSGHSFHEPWGDEYAGSKQPKYWCHLPQPPK